MCGATTEFDENTALIKNGEKRKDLCPECEPEVEAFIEERKQSVSTIKLPLLTSSPLDLTTALEIVKKAGFKITPTKRRSKN